MLISVLSWKTVHHLDISSIANAFPGEHFRGKTYARTPQRNQCNRKPESDAEGANPLDSIIVDLPGVVLTLLR